MASDSEPPGDGGRYNGGNGDGQGGYIVGKGRPPKHGQFAAGDGRPRGRRPKGQHNFDTDFQEEAARKVPVRENGRERRVSKQHAAIIRLLDNAYSKGQNAAIALVLAHASRLAEKVARPSDLPLADEAIVNDWLAQRVADLQQGDEPGDLPNPPYASDLEDNGGGSGEAQ